MRWHGQAPKFCRLLSNLLRQILMSRIERGDHLMAPGPVRRRPAQAPVEAREASFYNSPPFDTTKLLSSSALAATDLPYPVAMTAFT